MVLKHVQHTLLIILVWIDDHLIRVYWLLLVRRFQIVIVGLASSVASEIRGLVEQLLTSLNTLIYRQSTFLDTCLLLDTLEGHNWVFGNLAVFISTPHHPRHAWCRVWAVSLLATPRAYPLSLLCFSYHQLHILYVTYELGSKLFHLTHSLTATPAYTAGSPALLNCMRSRLGCLLLSTFLRSLEIVFLCAILGLRV